MAIASSKRPSDLAELVQAHQSGVWRYLRFLGADESLADDLTQETFVSVWKKPFVEHSAAATAGYLRTVARNLFLMSLRVRKHQPMIERLDAADRVWRHYTGEGDRRAAHSVPRSWNMAHAR